MQQTDTKLCVYIYLYKQYFIVSSFLFFFFALEKRKWLKPENKENGFVCSADLINQLMAST